VTIPLSTFKGARVTSARLQLAVVAVDADGRRSRPRPILELDPVEPLPAPAGFTAEPGPDGVTLRWSLPEGLKGVGVNLYRTLVAPAGEPAEATEVSAGAGSRGSGPGPARAGGRAAKPGWTPPKPIPGSPFAGGSAIDHTALLGRTYRYEARTASTDPGKGTRESPPAAGLLVEYLDRFPPGPPGLVTADWVAVAAPGGGEGAPPVRAVLVAWSPPLEADIAGYRVYRSAGGADFTLVGQVDAAQTSWSDADVKPGAAYRYCVTAIDSASPANESARSEIAEVAIGEREE
jgi:hypothetical protein